MIDSLFTLKTYSQELNCDKVYKYKIYNYTKLQLIIRALLYYTKLQLIIGLYDYARGGGGLSNIISQLKSVIESPIQKHAQFPM